MLRRLVIDNYKIFDKKQIMDFSAKHEKSENPSKLFTLVGENASGKSTVLKVVCFASNFGCRRPVENLRVCDGSRESVVACEYVLEFKSWEKLPRYHENSFARTHPEFKLWFLDGILIIPKELHKFLQDRMKITSGTLTLVIGFKRIPGSAISRLLFVRFNDQIIALIQPFDAKKAKIGLFEGSLTNDLLNWFPDPSKLEETLDIDFLGDSGKDHGLGPPSKIQRTDETQATVILNLLEAIYPPESSYAKPGFEDKWEQATKLFHKLTGDEKITVKYECQSIKIEEMLKGVRYQKDDLPQGFFYAFILAFVLVNEQTETVLLDEPTRGMHPLQIRRLRRILSQESSKPNKVIIVTTHAPDMLHGSPIDQIFRFRRYTSGCCEIRRVSSSLPEIESRFVGGAETRELFLTRRVIWVEGDTDRRFCEAMLKLIDEGEGGEEDLMKVALHDSPEQKDLEECRELVRTCSVLPLSGKGNIVKAVKICKDLDIPHCLIVDQDAYEPLKKKVENIFGWNVGGGEIEDVVRITRGSAFKKKNWKNFSPHDFQNLIEEMLEQGETKRPNHEILRCFKFILNFLSNSK